MEILSFFCHIMGMALAELVYVVDPMCSWCYAFTGPIHKAVETFGSRFSLRLIMGGLRPFEHAEILTPQLANFLDHHWRQIEQVSGQPFNYNLLKRIGLRYDTGPACRAVVTMRRLRPNLAFDYLTALQHHLFNVDADPSDIMALAGVAKDFALSASEFSHEYEKDEILNETYADFNEARQLQVQGFPCVLLRRGSEPYMVVTKGYVAQDELIRRLEQAMAVLNLP